MRPLRGSHLVILGFGNVGRWVGKLAKPFGVRITGMSRRPRPQPEYFTAGDAVTPANRLDTVLPHADHLMLALPSGPATDHIIDRRRLALLKPQAWLYNIGRGNAVDTAALAKALAAGRLAGACLDVFEEEPLPADHPLRALPNVLLMPHASAIAPNYLDLFLNEFIEHCRRR
jgi:phosphoglycerate dehydrogenase-like enzyme